jgi:hypothetical protein
MTDHQQAAIDAVIAEVKEHSWLTVPDEGSECACGFALTEFPLEYAGDAYWQHVASCLIAAAEPHLRKKWAEELVERIGASSLGAPLRIDPDGTFRMEGAGE